jgi:hypothetical protein
MVLIPLLRFGGNSEAHICFAGVIWRKALLLATSTRIKGSSFKQPHIRLGHPKEELKPFFTNFGTSLRATSSTVSPGAFFFSLLFPF